MVDMQRDNETRPVPTAPDRSTEYQPANLHRVGHQVGEADVAEAPVEGLVPPPLSHVRERGGERRAHGLGQLGDLTGYHSDSGNSVLRAVDTLLKPGQGCR